MNVPDESFYERELIQYFQGCSIEGGRVMFGVLAGSTNLLASGTCWSRIIALNREKSASEQDQEWHRAYHFRFLSRHVKHAANARRRGYPVFGRIRLVLPCALIVLCED
jgi:hypothetical protein